MSDDSENQDSSVVSNDTEALDSTQPTVSEPSFPQTDPIPLDVPPVAPEASPEPFTPSAGKDDNLEYSPEQFRVWPLEYGEQ